MQENLDIYEQILQMKNLRKRYIARFGPFGEQRFSCITNENEDYYKEYDFQEDDYNTER